MLFYPARKTVSEGWPNFLKTHKHGRTVYVMSTPSFLSFVNAPDKTCKAFVVTVWTPYIQVLIVAVWLDLSMHPNVSVLF